MVVGFLTRATVKAGQAVVVLVVSKLTLMLSSHYTSRSLSIPSPFYQVVSAGPTKWVDLTVVVSR